MEAKINQSQYDMTQVKFLSGYDSFYFFYKCFMGLGLFVSTVQASGVNSPEGGWFM